MLFIKKLNKLHPPTLISDCGVIGTIQSFLSPLSICLFLLHVCYHVAFPSHLCRQFFVSRSCIVNLCLHQWRQVPCAVLWRNDISHPIFFKMVCQLHVVFGLCKGFLVIFTPRPHFWPKGIAVVMSSACLSVCLPDHSSVSLFVHPTSRYCDNLKSNELGLPNVVCRYRSWRTSLHVDQLDPLARSQISSF